MQDTNSFNSSPVRHYGQGGLTKKMAMKKYLSILLLFVLAIYACDEPTFLVSDTYVRFDTPSSQISEADAGEGNVLIPVSIATAADNRSEAVTIEISVSGDATAGVHYNLISPTSLTVPSGELTAYIEVEIINNNVTDGAHDLTFEIVSNSASLNIGFPGPDALNSSHTLTIGDDDCAFDISIFEGTYDVNEDNGAYLYTAEVSMTGPNTIQVTNIWDSGMTVEVTLDASDVNNLRAYIEPQDTDVELCCATSAWVTSRPDANALAPVDAGLDDGTFTTCDGGFIVDFYIYVPGLGTFNGGQPVNAVYTRQ